MVIMAIRFQEKTPIRFQEKRFKKNVSFVSGSLARVYIVLKQENNPPIPLIPHLRVYHYALSIEH